MSLVGYLVPAPSARSPQRAKPSRRKYSSSEPTRARESRPGGKRGKANAEHHRRNREWAKEHPVQRDQAWLQREITPKLDPCSRFRAGTRVSHPRHWVAFYALAEGAERYMP